MNPLKYLNNSHTNSTGYDANEIEYIDEEVDNSEGITAYIKQHYSSTSLK